MGRNSGRARACEGRDPARRHRGGEPALPRRAHRRDPPRASGPPPAVRRDGRRDRRYLDREPHEDGRPRHGQARVGGHGDPEEAEAQDQADILGRKPDEDPAAAPADPPLHPGQGAGPARLLPRHAVLARRVRRQRARDDPLPRLALFRESCLGQGRGEGAGRLPRGRALPPGPARQRDRHGRGRPALSGQSQGDRRSPDAALLHPRLRRRPLRRRHPRVRGEGRALHSRLRGRARRAPGGGAVLRGPRRRDGVADGLLPRRRPCLQRHRGGGGDAVGARRAVCRRPSARVPDAGPVGGLGPGPRPGRGHHAHRPARNRRGHQPHRLRRPSWRGGLPGLRPCLRVRLLHEGDGALPRADREPCHQDRAARGPAPQAERREEGRRRPLRLPAERGRGRDRRLPQRFREPFQHAHPHEGRRLHGRGARERRCPPRSHPRRQREDLRAGGQCRRPCGRRHDGAQHAAPQGRRSCLGPCPGTRPVGRARGLRARPADGERLRGRPADLRLGRRPDAAALRTRLRADPRLRPVLPLAPQQLRRRRGPALRDARRARIHAGQAVGPWREGLAGPADRRDAERLSLRLEQPLRSDAGQAPVERGDGHAPDAAARGLGALQGASGAQGQPEPVARARPDGAGARGAGRPHRRAGSGGGPGRTQPGPAVAHAAGDRERADPRWAPCRRPPDGCGDDRAASRGAGRPGARDAGAGRGGAGARCRDGRADARAVGPLRGPGAGRRPDPVARRWSLRAATSTPSIPSGCPPPSRSRRRAAGGAAARNPCDRAAHRGAGALGLGQHQVGRRSDLPGAGAHGRGAALRRLRAAVGRGPHPARRTRSAPDRRGDDSVGHLPRSPAACRPRCWPRPPGRPPPPTSRWS
jgi:hypothetical protein